MISICIKHTTSQPFQFFGRHEELGLLDAALEQPQTSLVALIGPGGQGKTAIVQHWLQALEAGQRSLDGVFLWSFYRGKDVDLFLRDLYAFAAGLSAGPDVSAAYCVDHSLPILRPRRLVIVLDGTEVVQYESGPWHGRFMHPELGRLLEEVASGPLPGVFVLTTRFPLPELEHRPGARLVHLGGMDRVSARALLRGLGVCGSDAELNEAAQWCGDHAKAIELLGTLVVRQDNNAATGYRSLPEAEVVPQTTDEEHKVTRVLAAHRAALMPEAQDLLALATAFRDPPTQIRLLEYAVSAPVESLLHGHWGRTYEPFRLRGRSWVTDVLDDLIARRLLERVTRGQGSEAAVIDAHPLVRRAFEHVLGPAGRQQSAAARAGFLHGRPDRRAAATLDEAREEIEMFHAYCDAGLWAEADRTYTALDRPRYRFLAPAMERDLLLRFFPDSGWQQRPLWPGFRHYRALAICLELLGSFQEAVGVYREDDKPLRGDALLALGELAPFLTDARPPHPWETLWQAYRAHALCLAGRGPDATALACSLVPVDVYEWIHVFEALLRLGRLDVLDMHSFLYRPPRSSEPRWNELARRRLRADYVRMTTSDEDVGPVFAELMEDYDRSGLPYERVLVRLSFSRWLLHRDDVDNARQCSCTALELARRHQMRIMEVDATEVLAEVARRRGASAEAEALCEEAGRVRQAIGYLGPGRP